ncbi:MAG TPA: hypothetical protein VHQ47_18300 [Phycisphaerae bacterium]|nr:hypothetical protein [Phycisphaerae bacterium]
MAVAPYEEQLSLNRAWALMEGSMYFEQKSKVHEALTRITRRLNELGIPYAVVGGMALFQHGYRRFTEDVDLLVTRPGLKAIHEHLDGLGYVPPFEKSKNLRDVELGVKIEFLVTGDYPGDGKPKPVAFPDPTQASMEIDGIRFLQLGRLVELKLASGMTNPDRAKDLVDVSEMIKTLGLPESFANELDPYVRDEYVRLWRQSRKRFVRIWHPTQASDESQQRLLAAMQREGVTVEHPSDAQADYVLLMTYDPDIARKYDLHDEREFWDSEGR